MKNRKLYILLIALVIIASSVAYIVLKSRPPEENANSYFINNIYAYGDTDTLAVSAKMELNFDDSIGKTEIFRTWTIKNTGSTNSTYIIAVPNGISYTDNYGSYGCKVTGEGNSDVRGILCLADTSEKELPNKIEKAQVSAACNHFREMIRPAIILNVKPLHNGSSESEEVQEILNNIRLEVTYNSGLARLFRLGNGPLDSWDNYMDNPLGYPSGTKTEIYKLTVAGEGYTQEALQGRYDVPFFAVIPPNSLTLEHTKDTYKLLYVGEGDVRPEDYYEITRVECDEYDVIREYFKYLPPEQGAAEEDYAIYIKDFYENGQLHENINLDMTTIGTGQPEGVGRICFFEITVPPGDTRQIKYREVVDGEKYDTLHFLLNDDNDIGLESIEISVIGGMSNIERQNLGLDESKDTDNVIFGDCEGGTGFEEEYYENGYYISFNLPNDQTGSESEANEKLITIRDEFKTY